MVNKSRAVERRAVDLIPLHDTTRYFLAALVERSPQHGYSIINRVYELSEGIIDPGAGNAYVYIARLAEKGLIERQDPSKVKGRERVNYSITEFGREVFEEDYKFVQMTARKLSSIRKSQVNS